VTAVGRVEKETHKPPRAFHFQSHPRGEIHFSSTRKTA
jgi:hypothetical protein